MHRRDPNLGPNVDTHLNFGMLECLICQEVPLVNIAAGRMPESLQLYIVALSHLRSTRNTTGPLTTVSGWYTGP